MGFSCIISYRKRFHANGVLSRLINVCRWYHIMINVFFDTCMFIIAFLLAYDMLLIHVLFTFLLICLALLHQECTYAAIVSCVAMRILDHVRDAPHAYFACCLFCLAIFEIQIRRIILYAKNKLLPAGLIWVLALICIVVFPLMLFGCLVRIMQNNLILVENINGGTWKTNLANADELQKVVQQITEMWKTAQWNTTLVNLMDIYGFGSDAHCMIRHARWHTHLVNTDHLHRVSQWSMWQTAQWNTVFEANAEQQALFVQEISFIGCVMLWVVCGWLRYCTYLGCLVFDIYSKAVDIPPPVYPVPDK